MVLCQACIKQVGRIETFRGVKEMSMNDPIADMLTRIRNAQSVKDKEVQMPCSNQKIAILKVLKDEGYINDFKVTEVNNKKALIIFLKYYQNKAVIESIKRVSKAGLRVYRKHTELPVVRSGMGIAIISTSKGIITEKTARAQKLGGEVICTVE